MATLSTDAPICPLPQRMQHDMRLRGLGFRTQQDYVRHVRRSLCLLAARPPKPRNLARGLVIMSYQRKLPDVLNVEEAARLLKIPPGIQVQELRLRDGC